MSVSATTAIDFDTGNLKSYFYQSITEICDRRHLDSSDHSVAYIVNLLCQYARSDRLFDWDRDMGYDVRPLALLYGDAIQATNSNHRASALRRLGDVALFIGGIFCASLKRKPVDLDYYINMGGGAYGWLSEDLQQTGTTILDHGVFRELSELFPRFVQILNEFADSSGFRGKNNSIEQYEQWIDSESRKAAENSGHDEMDIPQIITQYKH